MRAGPLTASILILFLVSCRSAGLPGRGPFPSLNSSTSEEAWERLLDQRAAFGGARGFAKIKTTARSFRAAIRLDADGSFQVDVLSPVGFTIATVQARGREVTVIEGSERSTRSLDELATLLGLPGESWIAADLSLLLIGLPPADDRFEFDVATTGLRGVSGGGVEVRYEPPIFPPRKVILRSGNDRFELEYLELLRL